MGTDLRQALAVAGGRRIYRISEAGIVGSDWCKTPHPRPESGQLGHQRVAITRVVDYEISLLQAFFAGGLTGDAGPRIGFVHAPERDQSLDRDLDGRIDDGHTSDRIARVLDEQRDIEYHDMVSEEMLANAAAYGSADDGMNDRVQLGEYLGVREHNGCKRKPIE